MSKKVLGSVVELFVSKEDKIREQKEALTLELDGVCEDRFKGKDITRSILVVSLKSYEMAKQKGIDISKGDLGENILVDFDPYALEGGTKLRIGSAVIEISQRSSLCSSLSKINNKLPKLLKDKRGIFAKVICDGQVSVGDDISLNS